MAGGFRWEKIADGDIDTWDSLYSMNLRSAVVACRSALPAMLERGGGRIINIGAGAAAKAGLGMGAYAASKAGVQRLTEALAMEAEPLNIAINTMGPGKRIKPTSITRAEEEGLPAEERSQWVDPLQLAPAFVWLAAQPPARFTGLRFDAGPLADPIAVEGYAFDFAPAKATLYVDDFVQRQAARREWTCHQQLSIGERIDK